MSFRLAVIALFAAAVWLVQPLVSGATLAASSCPTGSTCVYVSPTGNDANPGTTAHPVLTLERAQRLVRAMDANMTENIAVILEGNSAYRLTKPLVLGPQDSGDNGYRVTWMAAPGSQPAISGAVRITGWRRSDARRGIWAASIPTGLETRQIYVDGTRAIPAEGPLPVNLTKTATGYTAGSSLMASWRNPSHIEFAYPFQLGQMAEPICPVASIRGRVITMAEPCWHNSSRRMELTDDAPYNNDLVATGDVNIPGYVENAYELLTQPGQFYLDGSKHVLYYIPRPGQNMNTADVEVPRLQQLVVDAATPTHPVHDITFSGIEFAFATWLQPDTPEGFSEVQAGYTITGANGVATEGLCRLVENGTCPYGAWTKEPGNVELRYDYDISFIGDRFLHLGASALNLDNGSQNDLVQGCVFTDISGNGIELGNTNMPEATGSSQTIGNQVLDNHLYDLPVEYRGGVAILVGYAANTTISHNQIDHVSYTAISLGWGGWLLKDGLPSVPNDSHDNVVSDNVIFDFLQVLADGGGVYTQGITGTSMADGEKAVGNVIHGELDWGAGLKSDNGSAFVTYSGNALYNNVDDWNSNHWNGPHTGTAFGPELIEANYWQQGDPDGAAAGETELGNSIIAGKSDLPAAVAGTAGIQPPFTSILSWHPDGLFPDAPMWVSTLEASRGRAFVTVHPSIDPQVVSYTLTTCQVMFDGGQSTCALGPAPVTMSAKSLWDIGYFTVYGLKASKPYAFTVTANTPTGRSDPSLPSRTLWAPSSAVAKPTAPTDLWANVSDTAATVGWYRPKSDTGWYGQVLGYIVKSSGGVVTQLPGRLQLNSNGGGKMLAVVTGLTPGRTYTVSVAASDAGGTGPATSMSINTPKGAAAGVHRILYLAHKLDMPAHRRRMFSGS